MSTLKFEVTIDEGNLLLAALAKQPYEAVANLINKLQQQAQTQIQAQQTDKVGS